MIYISSDHAGFKLKEELKNLLKSVGQEFTDLGPFENSRCDYSSYAISLAKKIQQNPSSRGILVCGSGLGVSMAANRFKGIRAALCRSTDDARLSREHNDANVICLGERMTETKTGLEIVKIFLETKFEGGRHQQRIDLFNSLGE